MLISIDIPYGHRLLSKDQAELYNTFQQFGAMLKKREDFRNVYILNGNKEFQKVSGLDWEVKARFDNRGISVSLLKLNR